MERPQQQSHISGPAFNLHLQFVVEGGKGDLEWRFRSRLVLPCPLGITDLIILFIENIYMLLNVSEISQLGAAWEFNLFCIWPMQKLKGEPYETILTLKPLENGRLECYVLLQLKGVQCWGHLTPLTPEETYLRNKRLVTWELLLWNSPVHHCPYL